MSTAQKTELPNVSEEDLKILNSPIGLKYLFMDKKVDIAKALRMTKYEIELKEFQAELVQLQNWVITNGKKIVILFEGRDAAGKGGAIRRFTAHINPRHFRIVALPKPTDEEEGQWYFQRYVNQLPKPGEIVFFDRSWYNRAVVEPVNGFCTQKQYEIFMGQVNEFERMIVESNTYLIKFYFSITKEEQERRFRDIKSSPLKKWKMTRVDERAQELWDEYTKYKVKMFEHTNTKNSKWIIIEADKKTKARIETIQHVLDYIPYQEKV
ncbi:polyphosphate kinase 2 [Aquimarina sp. 2304DJ70-9]|uniref:polyphosphate kinase 2 n=1 Tax=Aquimarina penaris TaxID=3231044 RepID=UPI003461EEB3